MKRLLLPILCCVAIATHAQQVTITAKKIGSTKSPKQDIVENKADALIVIDGVKSTKEAMATLDTETISSVNVLKNESATAKYGDEGKNGVIEITTKSIILKLKNNAESLPIDASERKDYPNKTIPKKINLPNDVLYVIDGVKASQQKLDSLKPDKIKSVNVLKGAAAIEKYGDRALNGAIEVSTKTNVQSIIENNIRDYWYFQRNGKAAINFTNWQKLPETERFIIDMTQFDNKNTLFIGIHNPLRINVSGKTSADVSVEIDNQGTVFQNELGEFVAQVGIPTPTIVTVKDKSTGAILATKTFKSTYLQPAQPYNRSNNQ